MQTLLLVLVAVTTVSFAQGFDDWDYFSDSYWWHGLRDSDSRISRANCLLYFNRPASNVIPESTIDQSTGIDLARHHIIPGQTLISFFNAALAHNGNNNIPFGGLIQILGALADNFMDYYEGNNIIDLNVREQLRRIRMTQLYLETGLDVSLSDLFRLRQLARAIFYWMPANIFMGPRHRADDPGNGFENNAHFILQNSTIFNLLGRINQSMNTYAVNGDIVVFNEVIEMLQSLGFMRIQAPYPFQAHQWRESYRNHAGLIFYEINTNPTVRTTTTAPVTRRYMKRAVKKRDGVEEDPLCFRPVVIYKNALQNDNLLIAINIVDRTVSGTGFEQKYSYSSWKHWFQDFSWKNGIVFNPNGMAKYGKSMADGKYGYVFNDNSFVAGIVGADLRDGNDNWTINPGWDVNTLGGQMFFDKNGRPVALAVSDEAKSNEDRGWIFVYSRQHKWKAPPSNDIAAAFSSVFSGAQTESLDATAMKFKLKKVKLSHDDGRELRSTRT